MQNLRQMYFSIVADYLDIIDILIGVTRSLIQDLCAEFVSLYLSALFVNIFSRSIYLAGNNIHYFHPYKLRITFLQETLLVMGLHLSIDADGILISVSDTPSLSSSSLSTFSWNISPKAHIIIER